jgi:hypothetical protein
MVRIRRIKAIATLGFIFLLSVVIIFFAGFFNTTTISVAYAKPNQMSHNLANSIDIPSIPAKKVHVTDIDIAYKTFGKGEPFLLISGSGLIMDAWESSILKNLSLVLEVTFPLGWVKSHPNVTIPQSKEIVIPSTLKQQFNLVKDWFAINRSGVCSQLPKISIPTLVITGTEDVSVPSANSLIIVQKIPGSWLVQIKGGGHGLLYQNPEQFSKIVRTFLETT